MFTELNNFLNFEHESAKFLIGKRSLDQISVDRNCVLSLDRNYVNHLIEFHLTESFINVILSYLNFRSTAKK